jgi:uncharacterized protein (DUF433 family)
LHQEGPFSTTSPQEGQKSRLQDRAKGRPDQRPEWEKEINEVRESVNGWGLSLANPRLDPSLRADIEGRYGRALARIAQLEGLLAQRSAGQEHLESILDPRQVLDRLHRLAEVLGGDNATRGNLELGLHIDRIDCFGDGQVLMRTSRLGVFEGAVELLGRTRVQGVGGQGDVPQPRGQVQPRRRARHRVDKEFSPENGRLPETEIATNPRRFAGLEDRWFWQDSLESPSKDASWSQSNAAEVAELRATGMTQEELAAHFGKALPTIRKALKVALAADTSLQLPRKTPRARWAEDNALEVAKFKAGGMTMSELAAHFGKSDPTIRAALKFAAGMESAEREGTSSAVVEPAVGGQGESVTTTPPHGSVAS